MVKKIKSSTLDHLGNSMKIIEHGLLTNQATEQRDRTTAPGLVFGVTWGDSKSTGSCRGPGILQWVSWLYNAWHPKLTSSWRLGECCKVWTLSTFTCSHSCPVGTVGNTVQYGILHGTMNGLIEIAQAAGKLSTFSNRRLQTLGCILVEWIFWESIWCDAGAHVYLVWKCTYTYLHLHVRRLV